MGTRHLQTVITKEGETKISQYGQWDGYPEGQGLDILKYLKSGNLEEYQKNLSGIVEITQDQADEINKDPNWKTNHPYLSRDYGSKIHQAIEDNILPFVVKINKDEADKWCEGFYTVDFNKNLFTSEYHGLIKVYPLDDLPTEKDYIKAMTQD